MDNKLEDFLEGLMKRDDITLRDLYAAAALASFRNRIYAEPEFVEASVEAAFVYADAALKARKFNAPKLHEKPADAPELPEHD